MSPRNTTRAPARRGRAARCVVVLGMHRGGTSALAGALNLMGVDLGRRLLPATSFNRRGYFEHEDVFRFNERLLYTIGRTWDDLRPLPEGWWKSDALAPLRDELRVLLEAEFRDVALWGVKDPRLCRLWPFWRGTLRSLGVTPAFVIVARPPREVARSLAKRDGFPGWKSDLLYLQHMLAAERATRGHARGIVTYGQLLREPAATLDGLARALRLTWPRPGAEADVAGFLSPSLRHHRSAGRGGPGERSRRVDDCYRAFARAAAGEERSVGAALDAIAAAVGEIHLPWGDVAAEVTRHADSVRAERDSSRRSQQILSAELDRSRVQIDARNDEIDAARRAAEARDVAEAELRSALQARVREVAGARAIIDELTRTVEAARCAHEARDTTEAALRSALQARVEEVDNARSHIDSLRQEIEAARRAHEARDTLEGELRSALQARIEEVDRARGNIDLLRQEIEAARRAHEARDVVETELRSALAALRDDLDAARRAELDQRATELGNLRAEHEAATERLHAEVSERDAALSELRGALTSREQGLAELRRELEDAHRQITELRQTGAELEWSLAEAERELAGETRALHDLTSRRLYGVVSGVWRPLRALRMLAAAPADQTVIGGLDPLPPEMDGGPCVLTGWAVATAGAGLRRIVLRIGGNLIEAERGLARPDAGRAVAVEGARSSGFRIVARLGTGLHRLAVKAEDENGRWHLIGAREVLVRRPPLQAALDDPRVNRLRSGTTRLAGWCCHPEERIRRLSVVFGAMTADCAYGLPRADVEAVFPDHPGSVECGFEATCRLPPGRGRISLRAELASGEVLVHTFPGVFTVLPAVVGASVRGATALATGGAAWLQLGRQVWNRVRDGRPLPPLRQLPARLRDVARLHRARERARAAGYAAVATAREPTDAYLCWQRVNAWHDGARAALARALTGAAPAVPRVSVLMAAPPGARGLEPTLANLREQLHGDWELCLALNAREADACATVRALRAEEPRIRFTCGEGHGSRIAALNAAALLATGDVVLVLDAQSRLAPEAVAELALEAAHTDAEVFYWDHDSYDERGRRAAPELKPGWSPELLLSWPYIGRAWAVRRALFTAVGGLREEARGAEDYDFLLRAVERARRVVHLPLVLQHHGAAANLEEPEPARRALEGALLRRGLSARPLWPEWARASGRAAFAIEFPHDGPRVAVVVYGDPGSEAEGPNLSAATRYGNYEVVRATADDIDAVARATRGEYLLFLDARLRPRAPAWLSHMVGWAQVPGVGAVGARLTGSDGRGQHVGITLGRDRGRARPLVMRGEGTGSAAGGPLAANRWAVGGGCLLTPRALFLQVDGFDEQMRHPFYRELDYCRRVTDAGHRCVYAAEAELTRPGDLGQDIVASPREEAVLRRTLPTGEDGFRSPYFTVADGTLRLQPRRLARHFRAPVRTLMCSFNLNREGAAWSQYELTVCLKEAGILDPVVFCPHDGPLRPAYEARGIEVRVQRHPLSGVFAEAAYARAIASFATLIRETGANLVYGNTAHTFYAIDAADAAGVPSVWNPRESEPPAQHFQHFGPAVAARALECFRLPYRVVFVADATREIYRSLETEHNFTVVHNGLDMARLEREAGRWTREEARRSLGIGDDEVVLLVLGTVCERKGQADLPSAVGRLPERLRPRVRCLVVGDRGLPYSRRVEAARAALPIELRARVTLLPETDEPFRFFRAADVFVCTSRIESFPRVTLEAMACGLPLVTTPVFGIREQVREGVNALFYQPGDTAGLGAALARLLEDDALRHHLAAQARPVLECLNDFDAMAEAYAEIFREASLTRAGALAGARGRDQ